MSAAIELIFTGIPAEADKFLFGTSTVALVRVADELIIFDTGPYAYRPILQGRLRRSGIDPGAVTKVVLSHLHWDNAANADLFHNADILVHERELNAAEAASGRDWACCRLSRAFLTLSATMMSAPLTFSPNWSCRLSNLRIRTGV